MKTNHQRGFVEKYRKYGIGKGEFTTFSGHGETVLSGRRINATATVASENSTGVRRDKAGAKKFVHSRTRFHEDAALKRLVRDGFDEE
jgi:hypothetical protein